VTTKDNEETRATEEEAGLKHGTVVLERPVKPWYGTGRIVCADSYFVSYEAAMHLRDRGLRLIGVVKTSTRMYPMKVLQSKLLPTRGQWKSFVTKDRSRTEQGGGAVLAMALVWVDRERRYFIATASSALSGSCYVRKRWRQFEYGAARVTFEISQPRVAEVYYACFAMIDRHNRCRQDGLQLERKYQT
jgi:Transposase IS4